MADLMDMIALDGEISIIEGKSYGHGRIGWKKATIDGIFDGHKEITSILSVFDGIWFTLMENFV